MSGPSDPVFRFAAAAVLQRVVWSGRTVDVPLSRVRHVDADEVELEMINGSTLIIYEGASAQAVRAAARRWVERADGPVVAMVFANEATRGELEEVPPDGLKAGLSLVFPESREVLGDAPWPTLADVLQEAATRRGDVPADVVDRLRRRVDQPWDDTPSHPVHPSFVGLTAVLAEGMSLVRLGAGFARFNRHDGDTVHVQTWADDPERDDRRLAHTLAWIAAELLAGEDAPHLLVLEGPADLEDRVQRVLGKVVRYGDIRSIGEGRRVDAALADVYRLARQVAADHDPTPSLERGLAETRGDRTTSDADQLRPEDLGRAIALSAALTDARVQMITGDQVRITWGRRLILVVSGPDFVRAPHRWRWLAAARAWVGLDTDLVVLGRDEADRAAFRAIEGPLPGHAFRADPNGPVVARAGLLGPFRPLAQALRKTAGSKPATLEEAEDAIEDAIIRDYRQEIVDDNFLDRLGIPTPWATYGTLATIGLVWALQLRWAADGAWGVRAGPWAVRMGALTGEAFSSPEIWRWWSHAFLHGSWWHLALNGLALWALGGRLEAILGPGRLLTLYLLSCLGGALFHEVSSSPGDVAVGSSSGILGLLAAQGALVVFRPDLIPREAGRIIGREVALNAVIITMMSFLPFVGAMAHLGGAVTGGLLAVIASSGVSPGESGDSGPTRPRETALTTAVAGSLGGLAILAVVAANLIGQPWILSAPEGKVIDRAVFGGAMTVPIPGSAGDPVEHQGPDAWTLTAGDPLRDGVRVEVRARALTEARVDLDAIAALREPGPPWTRVRAGSGPALGRSFDQIEGLSDLWRSGLYRSEWLLERGGVLVELHVIGTRDVVFSRLSGSPSRIAAGVSVQHPSSIPGPAAEVERWTAAIAGLPVEDPLLAGVAFAQAGQEAKAREVWSNAAESRAWRERAARLAQLAPPTAALPLAEVVLQRATEVERPPLQFARANALERQRRFPEALAALREAGPNVSGVWEAQILWHDRQDQEAARVAQAWLDEAVPTWMTLFAQPDDLPPAFLTNQAWAMFLAGDPSGCASLSERVLREDRDNVTAAFNSALCALANGRERDADRRYRHANVLARELGDLRAREGATRDLQGLALRQVPGADVLYRRHFEGPADQ